MDDKLRASKTTYISISITSEDPNSLILWEMNKMDPLKLETKSIRHYHQIEKHQRQQFQNLYLRWTIGQCQICTLSYPVSNMELFQMSVSQIKSSSGSPSRPGGTTKSPNVPRWFGPLLSRQTYVDVWNFYMENKFQHSNAFPVGLDVNG